MFLNDAVVAKGRVVKREAIVLVQQVAQELLPDFNGDGRDGTASVAEADCVFMV